MSNSSDLSIESKSWINDFIFEDPTEYKEVSENSDNLTKSNFETEIVSVNNNYENPPLAATLKEYLTNATLVACDKQNRVSSNEKIAYNEIEKRGENQKENVKLKRNPNKVDEEQILYSGEDKTNLVQKEETNQEKHIYFDQITTAMPNNNTKNQVHTSSSLNQFHVVNILENNRKIRRCPDQINYKPKLVSPHTSIRDPFLYNDVRFNITCKLSIVRNEPVPFRLRADQL